MRNRDVERMLSRAVRRAAPDVLDRVLDNWPPPDAAPPAAPSRLRAHRIHRLALTAAALLVLLAGAGHWHFNLQSVALVDLDVNPAIELGFNRQLRVISAEAVNGDGESVLGGMDLRGTTAEVAVNALLGSMLKQGYLGSDANAVLISAESADPAAADALRSQAERAASEVFAQSAFDGAVLSQRVDGGESLRRLAADHRTTLGKAALVEQLILLNPALNFDAVKDMPITDLSLVLSSKMQQPTGVRFIGEANADKYIGQARAIEAALSCHGQSAASVHSLSCEMDIDHGRMVYEVEFHRDQYDYECSVDALTGEVLEWEVEWEHPMLQSLSDD